MPSVEITGVTVSHVWDDGSKNKIVISKASFEDTGNYVSVKEDDQIIYFLADSWPEIRDQVQSMFDDLSSKE